MYKACWLFHLRFVILPPNLTDIGPHRPFNHKYVYLSCQVISRQVEVRKWVRKWKVGQCSYTPHDPMAMLGGNSRQNACIHIHIPNRRNDAPHQFSRDTLRCSIHCILQYTNDLWFLQSFRTSERFPMLQNVFCFVVLHHLLSSMSFLCTNPRGRPVWQNLVKSCSQVAEAEKTWLYV